MMDYQDALTEESETHYVFFKKIMEDKDKSEEIVDNLPEIFYPDLDVTNHKEFSPSSNIRMQNNDQNHEYAPQNYHSKHILIKIPEEWLEA